MEMGREVVNRGKVLGVHTPRQNKNRITLQTLSLLAAFVDVKAHIVVDHCSLKTIENVLAMGFKAGVTLSAEKATAKEELQIIRNNDESIQQIMLNTDSGTQVYDDLFMLRQSADLPDNIITMITRTSAGRFFGIRL